MKSTLEGINNRLNEAGEWISELEDRIVEITAAEQKKEESMKRNEDSLRDLWDNIKHMNAHIIVAPEKKRERKGLRKYLKR